MSDDEATTVRQMRERVATFARERDWEQFHNPKDLAVGLSIESAELLELFLWKTPGEIDEMVRQAEPRGRIAEELADVLIFCLNFANRVGLDVATIVTAKLEANASKYPIHKAKGIAKKYTQL